MGSSSEVASLAKMLGVALRQARSRCATPAASFSRGFCSSSALRPVVVKFPGGSPVTQAEMLGTLFKDARSQETAIAVLHNPMDALQKNVLYRADTGDETKGERRIHTGEWGMLTHPKYGQVEGWTCCHCLYDDAPGCMIAPADWVDPNER